MWPNPHFSTDLVTFTKEMLYEKVHFLCNVEGANSVWFQRETAINFYPGHIFCVMLLLIQKILSHYHYFLCLNNCYNLQITLILHSVHFLKYSNYFCLKLGVAKLKAIVAKEISIVVFSQVPKYAFEFCLWIPLLLK